MQWNDLGGCLLSSAGWMQAVPGAPGGTLLAAWAQMS